MVKRDIIVMVLLAIGNIIVTSIFVGMNTEYSNNTNEVEYAAVGEDSNNSYNAVIDIWSIVSERTNIDRGKESFYFDALSEEMQRNIVFYESIMICMGYPSNEVDRLFTLYRDIAELKDADESVVEISEDGEYKFKDKFNTIVFNIGINDIEKIAKMLSTDEQLVMAEDMKEFIIEVPLEYEVGYRNRENMITAALSLVGDVRYVWGGGHLGTANIKGVNPIWSYFNDLYRASDKDEYCIEPKKSWCPIHGENQDIGSCLEGDVEIESIEEYFEVRQSLYSDTTFKEIKIDEIKEIIDREDLKYNGYSIDAHRIEGLDCSGFLCWVFNQIDSDQVYESSASVFVQNSGLLEITMGSRLYPGDVVAWDTHCVLIVGSFENSNDVYIHVESSPDEVKVGVSHYGKAGWAQIVRAKEFAKEVNELLGNIGESKINVFNLNELEYKEIELIDEPDINGDIVIETEGEQKYDVEISIEDFEEIMEEDTEGTEDVENEGELENSTDGGIIEMEEIEIDTEPVEAIAVRTAAITIEEVKTELQKVLYIGRFSKGFKDDTAIVEGYGRRFRDLKAEDIIEHISKKIG